MGAEQAAGEPSRELVLAQGKTLIHEGELGDTAYCIVDGEVQVWKRSGTGAVELARLGPGAIFGEMSLVDEKPRSASITALRETRLKEVKRDQFLDSFQHDPEFATSLLRVLFERLRETGAKLTQLQPSVQTEHPRDQALPSVQTARTPTAGPADCCSLGLTLMIEGLTEVAKDALPSNPYKIERLPFRIGRQSGDKLAYNDLALQDMAPYQISVNHLLIFVQQNTDGQNIEVGIFDRGSSLGSRLNGVMLGGLMANENATILPVGNSELILGEEDSPFRFCIKMSRD